MRIPWPTPMQDDLRRGSHLRGECPVAHIPLFWIEPRAASDQPNRTTRSKQQQHHHKFTIFLLHTQVLIKVAVGGSGAPQLISVLFSPSMNHGYSVACSSWWEIHSCLMEWCRWINPYLTLHSPCGGRRGLHGERSRYVHFLLFCQNTELWDTHYYIFYQNVELWATHYYL